MKDGKFVISNNKNFKILGSYETDLNLNHKSFYNMVNQNKIFFISKGTNKVYKKIGSSKIAFKLKNGQKFSRQKIYIKDRKTYYLKIKTKSGKTGYVKNGQVKVEEDSVNESGNQDSMWFQDCMLN